MLPKDYWHHRSFHFYCIVSVVKFSASNSILSVVTGYDLNCVNRYISKLYENIAALVYEEREDGEKKWLNLITSVRSFEGETLQLSQVFSIYLFILEYVLY